MTAAGRILILMNLTFLKHFLEGTSFLEYIFFGHKSMNYISYYITFKNIFFLRFSTAFHNGFLCSFSSVHKHVKHPGAHIILHSCVVTGKMLSGLGFNKYCEGNNESNYGYKPANKIK